MPYLKARIEKATSLLTAEEERQLKLEVGADWPPRTKPQEGEGYKVQRNASWFPLVFVIFF